MKGLIEKEIRIHSDSRGYISNEEIKSDKDAIRVLQNELADLANEKALALFLSTRGYPICCQTAGVGNVNSSYVSIQNIVKMALLVNARSVVLLHNHPSNFVFPSPEDIDLTNRLNKALELLELKLLDHLIVCPSKDTYSFRANNLIS